LNVPSSGIHTTLVPLEAGTESWPMEYIWIFRIRKIVKRVVDIKR